jgi:PadR family transcriptional regulator, regulatory protein AphA
MANVKTPPLTTTSYAILGQLAWGEATTYELVKAMRRNLRYLWPRAESRIYEEAKRLVDVGYLAARTGATGKRPRTSYSITQAGLDALQAWLAQPARGAFTLEHEPILRVFLGGRGQPEDLLATVAAVRTQAEEMLAIGRPLADEYFDHVHPQQHEVHLRALTFDFLYRWALLNKDWAARAEQEISRWQTVELDPSKEHRALGRLRETLAIDKQTQR